MIRDITNFLLCVCLPVLLVIVVSAPALNQSDNVPAGVAYQTEAR